MSVFSIRQTGTEARPYRTVVRGGNVVPTAAMER